MKGQEHVIPRSAETDRDDAGPRLPKDRLARELSAAQLWARSRDVGVARQEARARLGLALGDRDRAGLGILVLFLNLLCIFTINIKIF